MTTPAPPPSELSGSPASEGQTGRWQRASLRNRVTLLAAACVAGAVALVSVGAFLTVRDSLYEQVDQNLRERASQAVSGPQVLEPNLRSVPAAFYAAANLRICLVTADGRALTGPGKTPPWGPAELAVARGLTESSLRTDDATNSRVVALPAGNDRALVMSQSLASTKATLAQLSVVLVVIGGAGILLAAAAGTAVARTALRPVQRLTAATERIARTGDLRPIPVSGDDELARLTTSFNKMLGALAESQEQQRRLVADAGHELRTPLTSLRTNLELLMASDRPGSPRLSDEDRAEMLGDVQAQITELSALVGDLVELAREDAPNAVHEPLELVDVVERALSRARRRASEVEFDVRLEQWSMLGDATALERAVLNLLDNAAKWSPAGGIVRVESRRLDAGFAVFEVADSGPGIPEEDRRHVFERFYRSTEARPLRGSGLGLAIVKQVAERHGGSVAAGEAPEGGAMISMYLPGHADPEQSDPQRPARST
ncbi:two-component system, OmpR family, sensor histidine kinase MprB [Actinopolyspora alba]|uniref:histidine kinase n=1 Tax=Actinopolyspora alba TaxID=673379 RepID=A0A1I1ZHK3_9ACTN|nr:HAMP domain-containing sensor histidine kinase [Actinopolyspora alba]SFE29820.1 two-component system, OmpR family, sensor histidine kinase MprB [Actinopolyspora alba]